MNELVFTKAFTLIIIVVSLNISFAEQETMSPQFSIGYAKHDDRLPITGAVLLTWTAGGTESQSVSFKVPDVLARGDLTVRIFDVKGKCICVKRALSWDGKDHLGRRICSGYYLFTIDESDNAVPPQFIFDNGSDFYFWDVTANYMPVDSTWPRDMEAGDIDNDGDLDIVIGCQQTSAATQSRVLMNSGNGTFIDETESRFPDILLYTNDVNLADIDNDGDLDIYLAVTGTEPVEYADKIFVNDGRGYFQDETVLRIPQVAIPTWNACFTDVDGDDDLDLIVVYMPYEISGADVRIYLNSGAGFFTPGEAGRIGLSEVSAFNVAPADVDDDGDADLVIAVIGAKYEFNQYNGQVDTISGQNILLMNDGSGWFEDQTKMRMPNIPEDRTREINIGDVNNDGAMDLYAVNLGFQGIGFDAERDIGTNTLLINDGNGYFADESGTRLPWETYIWNNDVDFEDVDLDGDPDLLLVNVLPGKNGYDALLINTGSGVYVDESWLLPRVFDFSTSCVFGDVSGDHDPDIVIANSSPAVDSVDGQDRLYINMLFPDPCISKGDVNYDGRIDINDILLCVGMIIHTYHPQQPEFLCADVNDDGSINALDVVILISEIITKP